jgi:hypothetical protein
VLDICILLIKIIPKGHKRNSVTAERTKELNILLQDFVGKDSLHFNLHPTRLPDEIRGVGFLF